MGWGPAKLRLERRAVNSNAARWRFASDVRSFREFTRHGDVTTACKLHGLSFRTRNTGEEWHAFTTRDRRPMTDSPTPGPHVDLRAELEQHLGAAYSLGRELGGGGMSRVFLAEEVRLGRTVVVKVLSPELAQGLNIDRFERE